jgi:hypothetical protein
MEIYYGKNGERIPFHYDEPGWAALVELRRLIIE